MVSQRTPSSRTRLLARSRLYMAALVTGGVAAGAGFTVAAAHADTPATATPAKHTVTGNDGHRGSRSPHVRQSQAPKSAAPSAPSVPVHSAPSQSAQQPQPQRAGSSHAS